MTQFSADGHGRRSVTYIIAGHAERPGQPRHRRSGPQRSCPRSSAGSRASRRSSRATRPDARRRHDFYDAGHAARHGLRARLSFLLLLIAFRSIVIPIKAILLNLLSTAAAYGVLVLVFQEGWLGDALGVKPRRHRGIRAGVHLHDPVRPLDGLPRLHPDADQGGARSRARIERGGGRAASRSPREPSPAPPRSWSWSSRVS